MAASWLELIGDMGMLVTSAIALFVSLAFLVIVTLFQGRSLSVSLLMASNTFLCALVYSTAHLAIAAATLHSDMIARGPIRRAIYNPTCLSSAFVFYSGCALLYYSYVLQAAQRFTCVVLPKYQWVQKHRFQLLLIAFQWSLCLIVTFVPLATTNQLQYDISMNICIVPIRSSGWTVYYAILCYFIPLMLIGIFYQRLIQHTRIVHGRIRACLVPSSTIVAARRQLVLMQRVIIHVSILLISGLPYCAFILIGFWTNPPIFQFRISFLCVDIALGSVVCAMFFYSKNKLRPKMPRQIRVQPVPLSATNLTTVKIEPRRCQR